MAAGSSTKCPLPVVSFRQASKVVSRWPDAHDDLKVVPSRPQTVTGFAAVGLPSRLPTISGRLGFEPSGKAGGFVSSPRHAEGAQLARDPFRPQRAERESTFMSCRQLERG